MHARQVTGSFSVESFNKENHYCFLMKKRGAWKWVAEKARTQKVILALDHPSTSSQLAKHVGDKPERTSRILRRMVAESLAECLNPNAQSSRIYGLTDLGHWCRKRLVQQRDDKTKVRPISGLPTEILPISTGFDWELLGWVSFRHRAAVIKALVGPMQAVSIRRKAVQHNPALRMSANNVREVLRCLLERDVVERIEVPNSVYPHFELTPVGKQLQAYLWRTEGLS